METIGCSIEGVPPLACGIYGWIVCAPLQILDGLGRLLAHVNSLIIVYVLVEDVASGRVNGGRLGHLIATSSKRV